jgi:Fe-S cluster biogenesis protein NfuA
VKEAVRRALENKVRPAIQLDGGDVELLGVENGVVTVRMFGACDGCPLSPVTLRAGIERILRDEIPDIREVVAIEG